MPALALTVGYPDMVCEGLGSPYPEWIKDANTRFGLYAYTVSDIAIGLICTASLTTDLVNEDTALLSVAGHQLAYLCAAIPSFGFQPMYVASIATAMISGFLTKY